ncbi:MAG: HAD family hydrolase [Anaerolineaceae bacterium]|nr:HAD family hydrolase [Anaerolineaceae bacterium]
MQIQAILFDLGNTLSKSASFVEALLQLENTPFSQSLGLDREALTTIGEEFGKNIRELYSKDDLTQPHWFDVWQAAAINSSINLTDVQITELSYAHLNAFLQQSQVEPYAIPLLSMIKENQIPLGLISNVTGPVELFAADFQNKGMADYFDVIIWSNVIGVRKPDKRIFQTALDGLNLQASKQIIMVGDNETADILGGNAMGFTTIKVIDDETQEDSAADYVVNKVGMIEFFKSNIIETI